MLTVEEIRALGHVHPQFEPIIKAQNSMLNGWDMSTDLSAFREMMAQARRSRPKPDPETLSYRTQDFKIPLRDRFEVDARLYTPKGDAPSDGRPGMIVFHGGGFITGDLETEAGLCIEFTKLGGTVLNVDYRHAPEHIFPQAINDAFDATVWASQNVDKLGINPYKGFIVGGTSSGADISLTVSHLYRDTQTTPPLTGVYAPITSGVNADTVPEKYKDYFVSMEQNARVPVYNAESMKFIHSKYKPDPKSPLAFPIAFPSHAGLPKTYFQACGMDPVRDSSIILEQTYRDDKVPTKIDIYPGLPHAFWAVFPELEISQKRERDAVEDGPAIAKRQAAKAAALKEGRDPPVHNDAIEWFEQASKGASYDPALSQLFLSTVAIHTTTDLLCQTMIDIARHPELFEPLREEITTVLREEGWKKTSLYIMQLVDSVVKESQRLKPLQLASMQRLDVTDVQLSDGTFIPKGTASCVSSHALWDPSVYDAPEKWDGYRFLHQRKESAKENLSQLVSTSENHLGFGHGKHACPVRFFAANEIKIALAHLLLEYDWRLPEGEGFDVHDFGITPIMNQTLKMEFRKRE